MSAATKLKKSFYATGVSVGYSESRSIGFYCAADSYDSAFSAAQSIADKRFPRRENIIQALQVLNGNAWLVMGPEVAE